MRVFTMHSRQSERNQSMTTSKGFDTGSDCTPHGQQILDGGYSFCARYTFSGVSHAKTKLTHKEAAHLSGMGIYLVNVFQNSADHAEYFSRKQGTSDGMAAFAYANDVLQQPHSAPVYFAVDFDASEEDMRRRVIPYFLALDNVRGQYQCGVYGSGLVCRKLHELGLVSFTWLAQSMGFRESKAYRDGKQWSLLQHMQTTFHGLQIDPLESQGNGGGFKVS